ncbi:MAG: GNAT family N-acetyltransferase [Bacteroidetes bacterium]|nr:MAG: GNAT family N-acetyltransferase [Bacteroidota bacterium]
MEISEIKVNEHITLRQIARSDAADIFYTIKSQRSYLITWLPFVAWTSKISDTEAFIDHVQNTTEDKAEPVFVIRFDDEFAGIIGFKDTDRINKKTEIGYWLSESFQKKGIITLSLKELLKLAFEKMKINRVQIRCAVGNTASSKIPRRLGFKLEGIEREGELLSNGKFANLEVYSLLNAEFK